MVGQLLIAGIPNLNLLYEGEEGIVACHLWDGKYVIHSELYQEEPSLEDLKAAKHISDEIDKVFAERGIEEIFTWAENKTQERYNKFLGYVDTGETVNHTFVDKTYPYPMKEFKKRLN